MDMSMKIKMAETYAKVKEAELARRLGTSSQALGQRVKTGKFTVAELEKIAEALGCEFVCCFKFPDGEQI